MTQSKKAFTLAEVLVTLGVIGVVAAMTLPSLINKYKTKEASTRLKKFYSIMSQAILFSENVNGPSKYWTKTSQIKDDDGNYISKTNREATLEYFNTYLKPYLKYLKVDENPKDLQDEDTGEASSIRIYLSDGSTFTMYNGACTDMIFDVNGLKLPNQNGKDKFDFVLCPEDKFENECDNIRNFCPYYGSHTTTVTREMALKQCKSKGQTCARLLMLDGWEFKDDYPYKL